MRSEWLDQQSLYAGGGKAGLAQAIKDEAAAYATATDKLWVIQGILTFDPGTLENYAKDGEWDKLRTWLNGNRGAADSVNGWVKDWALNGGYTSHLNILLGDWAEAADLVKTAVAANLTKAGLNYLNPGIEGLPLLDSEPLGAPQTPQEATVYSIPDVIPPRDLWLDATGEQTLVELGESSAYDYIDGWLSSQPVAATASYPIGRHHILWTAQDAAGVQGVATQTVWIVACHPKADRTELWPANRQMVPVTINANVVPALRGKVILSASVQSNQPETGTHTSDRGPDWTMPEINQTTGAIRVGLKAENRGDHDRVYTIIVTATDSQGHQSDAVVHVTVPTTPPGQWPVRREATREHISPRHARATNR